MKAFTCVFMLKYKSFTLHPFDQSPFLVWLSVRSPVFYNIKNSNLKCIQFKFCFRLHITFGKLEKTTFVFFYLRSKLQTDLVKEKGGEEENVNYLLQVSLCRKTQNSWVWFKICLKSRVCCAFICLHLYFYYIFSYTEYKPHCQDWNWIIYFSVFFISKILPIITPCVYPNLVTKWQKLSLISCTVSTIVFWKWNTSFNFAAQHSHRAV